MIWLVPVGIAGAVVAIALLWPKKASGAGAGPGFGPIGGDEMSLPPLDKASGTDTGGGTVFRTPTKPTPDPLEGMKPPTVETMPTPTPGFYYRIRQYDIGSALAAKAYNPARPTAVWMRVASHPVNQELHAGAYDPWFLPRWDAPGKVNLGKYTGLYALIYFPSRDQVGL